MSDENFYFALAMACVDVDHPRPGDRPEAAYRLLGQAAGASDAPSLLRAPLAPRHLCPANHSPTDGAVAPRHPSPTADEIKPHASPRQPAD